MKPIQIILIAVAAVCALGAGFIMMNLLNQPAPEVAVETIVEKAPEKRVLVARENILMGANLTRDNMEWQAWPESGVREGFVTEDMNAEAMETFEKSIARSTFYAGEPIREEKVVRSDSGYLSAILPAGKRAVAITVEAQTSAGGFVLPNDHVDVIMSFQNDKEEWVTETILENVRVLAIDQVIEEENGEKSKVGDTATLELTPEQAQIISVSSRIAQNNLMLALRSIEDIKEEGTGGASHLLSNGSRKKKGTIRLVRFGKSNEIRPKK
ncbi:MAG: Flp pilus assembly protein CpaB [Pseudomonadota bacterium]